ncbi:hypothetical protein Glove_87g267 [Diversispora epigaea]|uniref:Uncharacterized protein n=1 Tax=Diversispora epigaea TaxID=1348612 RepID=A0A397J634_9GLOM|nr:hypothetical protein Glove_87g267 [Diversispora epigaea]
MEKRTQGELNLVLEDINNIHEFCKDKNSLKAAQEPKLIITRPTISRSGSVLQQIFSVQPTKTSTSKNTTSRNSFRGTIYMPQILSVLQILLLILILIKIIQVWGNSKNTASIGGGKIRKTN